MPLPSLPAEVRHSTSTCGKTQPIYKIVYDPTGYSISLLFVCCICCPFDSSPYKQTKSMPLEKWCNFFSSKLWKCFCSNISILCHMFSSTSHLQKKKTFNSRFFYHFGKHLFQNNCFFISYTEIR
jgi:hypothetical protein